MAVLKRWGRPKGTAMSQEQKDFLSDSMKAWHAKNKAKHAEAVKAGILKARTESDE